MSSNRRLYEHPVVYPSKLEVQALLHLFNDVGVDPRKVDVPHAVRAALRATLNLYVKCRAVTRVFVVVSGLWLPACVRQRYFTAKTMWVDTLHRLGDGRAHPRTLRNLDALLRDLAPYLAPGSDNAVARNLRYWQVKTPDRVLARRRAAQLAKGV